MVNLIFREGNRQVNPVWETKPILVEMCAKVMASNISRIGCPSHRSRSRATLLIDVAPGSGEWDIVDYCCQDFCRAVTEEMPYPWNHTPGVRKLERAA